MRSEKPQVAKVFLPLLLQEPRSRSQPAKRPFLKKKPSQDAKIVQDSAASVHVKIKLVQRVESEFQCLCAPREIRPQLFLDVRFEIKFRLEDSLGQKRHKVVSVFDTVKRGLGSWVHRRRLFHFQGV